MVPGRGPALKSADEVRKGLAGTRAFLTDLYTCVNTGVADGKDLKTIYRETYDFMKPRYADWVIFDHCMPFDVKDEKGEVVNWELELGSPNGLMRQGWTRNSLKKGDVVTITGSLAKDGSKLANARTVTLSDGRR